MFSSLFAVIISAVMFHYSLLGCLLIYFHSLQFYNTSMGSQFPGHIRALISQRYGNYNYNGRKLKGCKDHLPGII